MLQRNAVFGQNIQYVPAETDLAVHHILVNADGGKVLLAGNPGNGVGRELFLSAVRNNHCARLFRRIGIANVNGNTSRAYRENSGFMQYRGTHVGKLPQLCISNGADYSRVLYDSGICYQEAGNVCPVFIEICLHCTGYNRTGYIAAAPGKGLDIAVCAAAIEAGDHCIGHIFQTLPQGCCCLFIIQRAVRAEKNHFCRINKREAQISRNHLAVQIFSAAGRIVLAGTLPEIFCNYSEFLCEGQCHPQAGNDILIPCLDSFQLCLERKSLFCQSIACIEHVCYLGVCGKALSRCRGHYIPPLRVCLYDCSSLLNLIGICQTASAEFYYFCRHSCIMRSGFRSLSLLEIFVILSKSQKKQEILAIHAVPCHTILVYAFFRKKSIGKTDKFFRIFSVLLVNTPVLVERTL